jgi:carotenoid cleavage dioxygenase-like enzyme
MPFSDHRLGFQSLDTELSQTELPVDGILPDWLAGALFRIGPARFEAGDDRYNHWFDGLAMLHRFAFGGNSVTYSNRFLHSRAYRAARDTGRISYSEFATDPCRSLFKRVATSFLPPKFGENTNVNIVKRGEEFLAMTETSLPVRFDPATLETLGVAEPAPGQMTVAHPHRAPLTREHVSYATHFGPLTTYRVYAHDAAAGRRTIAEFPVQRPAYMHSFAITEHYVVLAEFPFIVIPVAIPLSGRPLIENYHWKPARGTRFRVLDIATGDIKATVQGESFFAFHHVNAFERGDEIVLDVCGYDDPGIIKALYLDQLRGPQARPPEARLRRYRIPAGRSGRDATREPMPDAPLELPRIDYDRRNGRPYRYVYGTGSDGGFPDRITKVDIEEGTSTHWREPGSFPGEPIFIRTPGTTREDAGVLLSVVLDPARGTSCLLVLDATDLTEVGRAQVPHHIPFGFHGDYFPEPATV